MIQTPNRHTNFSNLLALVLLLLVPQFATGQEEKLPRNKITLRSNENGNYHLFLPRVEPTRILVIAHGTPGTNENTVDLSEKFIKRWTDFAKRRKLLLISVAFDRQNFGSDGKSGYGGYRGLFGRKIGADDHVIELIEKFQPLCSIQDGRALLYGHSAGGQFLIRFCVTHPNRVAAAVASAPGRFTFPTESARWPYGAGKFVRDITWSPNEKTKVVVEPDLNTFRQAAQLPIAVIYGENDLEKQPRRDAHPGTTRIDFGSGWVDAMNAFGRLEKPSIRLILEKGIGHSSSRLTIPCQKELTRLEWIQPEKTEVMRTWRSKNRKFKVRARLVEFDGSNVKLLTDDGKALNLRADKLCQADRKFINDN